jgi:hypothetical protein
MTITVNNPSSNGYSITGFTVSAASGWGLTGAGTATTFTCTTLTNSIQCVGGNLAPGGSISLTGVSFQGPSVTSYPASGTFSTTIQDASSSAFYPGPTWIQYEIQSGTTVSWTPASVTNFVAGSAPLSFTVALGGAGSADSNVPLSFTATAGTFSASSGSTSSGSVTVTYTPSNLIGTATLTATVGTSAVANTATVTTLAAAPASICYSFTAVCGGAGSVAFPSVHYVGGAGGFVTISGTNYANIATNTIFFTVSDRFGNPDSAGVSGASTTFTALSGGGFWDSTPATTSVIFAAATGSIPHTYQQSGAFATIGLISGTLTGTYSGSTFSVSGNTGQISTSTFDTGTSAKPTVLASSVLPASATCVSSVAGGSCQAAGGTATVQYQLTNAQAGVPVQLSLDPSSTQVNNNGRFAGAKHTIATTNTAGLASATFTVDTGITAVGIFNANVSAPIDGTPTHYLGGSPASTAASTVYTLAGSASTFVISVCFFATAYPCVAANVVSNGLVGGNTAYVVVNLADAYGNTATNPGPNNIQMTLSTSAGVLSVTTAYFNTGASSTYPSFGWIAWTMPSTLGTKVTLSASGVLTGKTTTASTSVTTVSALPTFSVKSPAPLSGVIYSNTGTVVFNGQANASLGYASSVNIASVGYKIGSGHWISAPIVTGNKIVWSLAATFPAGLSTIMFNATDSTAAANTYVSQSYTVLVDTSAPTITATTASGSTVPAGTPIMFSIVDTEGDLNATSVTASSNSTATLTATVTGTNNVGSSVTYTVAVSGLPTSTGHWSVSLNAKDYAGNKATAVTTVVKVTVAFAQSAVLQGSASVTTIGGYKGIQVSYANEWTTSQNLIVFAVWKNSAGQTVAVTTGGLTLSSGATGPAFAPLSSPPASGSYTVNIFVWTTGNNPISITTTIAASI